MTAVALKLQPPHKDPLAVDELTRAKNFHDLDERDFKGYPGQKCSLINGASARCLYPVDERNFLPQRYEWDCGPSSLLLGFRLLGGPVLDHDELIRITGANAEVGTSDAHIRDAVEAFADYYEYQMGEHGNFSLLGHLLRHGYVVIVNFREPIDGTGHFALVKAVGRRAIELSDPWYGPSSVIAKKDFCWKSGFERPARERWYFALRPRNLAER